MNNDSNKITANEINKFSYCPYQFYYERLYGRKHISQTRKEMLDGLGYKQDDKTMSNLKRGLDYHNNYKTSDKSSYPVFKLMILVILIVIGFAFYEQLYIYISNIIELFNVT